MSADAGADRRGIAVIGAAARLPGAPTLEAFWANLCAGVESLSRFSRAELAAAGIAAAVAADERYVPARGVLAGIELFDAAFFGLSPREAEVMDPQQRVFLECAWEAIEAAGYDPFRYGGAIGVFAGSATSHYLHHNLAPHGYRPGPLGDLDIGIGNERDSLATLTAYKLNLTGPCLTVQTFCSTSLVAVHLACASLHSYECDMALAGGVAIEVPQQAGYTWLEGGFASPDGHCRAFDAAARGTPFGNGAGVVLLKRLPEALAAGDPVIAVIRGSAVNNDGALKVSYAAPSLTGQVRVIAEALADAGVAPETVGFVEGHGTGTPLGDAVEVAALVQAFGAVSPHGALCALGSVKTNLGHLDRAAGIAGFLKALLAVHHGLVPPTLHFQHPSPESALGKSSFFVNTTLTPWPRREGPRRAGVSSFGMGGTNAHVVLEEAPPRRPASIRTTPRASPAEPVSLSHRATPAEPAPPASTPGRRRWQLLVLSARSETALAGAAGNLARRLAHHPEPPEPPEPPEDTERDAPGPSPGASDEESLADVAYTLQVGRSEMAHRLALVCREPGEAVAELEAHRLAGRCPGEAIAVPCRLLTHVAQEEDRPVMFLFPGLGEHYPGMARGIYDSEPVFRAEVDRCAELLAPDLGLDLRSVLYPPGAARSAGREGGERDRLRRLLGRGERDGASEEPELGELGRTRLAQPATFVVSYALARLWISWGIRPRGLLGYSVGELVAACVSGVLGLADALRLVARRAALIEALPPGAMLAVPLGMREVEGLLVREGLAGELEVAIEGDEELSIVGGPAPAVGRLEEALARGGTASRQVPARHAFHTRMMAGAAEELARLFGQVERRPPEIPFVSNVTGTWIGEREAREPAYWARQLVGAVRLGSSLETLLAEPSCILLEVGPGQSLGSLALRQAQAAEAGPGAVEERGERVVLASLRGRHGGPEDGEQLLETLGRLWLHGARVDWEKVHGEEPRRRVSLPTYPFERQRYWIEPIAPPGAAANDRSGPDSGARPPDVASWFYLPVWRQAPLPLEALDAAAGDRSTGPWLLLIDRGGIGERIAERLRRAGQEVATVAAGTAFGCSATGRFMVAPARREDYGVLLDRLGAGGRRLPRRIVHLWGLDRVAGPAAGAGRDSPELDRPEVVAGRDSPELDRPAVIAGRAGPEPAGDGGFSSALAELEEAQRLGFFSLLFLVQALAVRGAEAGGSLAVVTGPLHSVAGTEPLRPEAATVLGPCRVIPLEYPAWSCRLVDVLVTEEDRDALADQLLTELLAGEGDEVVAYRHGLRWLPGNLPAPLLEGQGPVPRTRLRQRGVYLISGGLGDLGLVVAECLARSVQARLVLVGRHGPPPVSASDGSRAAAAEGSPAGSAGKAAPPAPAAASAEASPAALQRRLLQLAALGAEVLTLAADVTDPGQMGRAIEATLARFGALHGVFHLAGVLDDALMQSKTASSAEAVLAPKLRGTLVLDRLLRGRGVDFLALFSSLAATTGNLGQVDHCAANAFLDAFAERRSRAGAPVVISLAWDAWSEVGQAAKTLGRLDARSEFAALLRGGIATERGAAALLQSFALRPVPRLLISPRDPAALAGAVRRAARGLATAARGRRSPSGVAFQAPRGDAEEAVAAIWREVLRLDRVGANDSFLSLGGHSLLAIQVLSRLRARFGVEVPLRAFFAARSLAEVARLVEDLIVAELAGLDEETAERLAAAGEAPADRPDAAERVRVTLPNGLSVLTLSPAEASHFYHDIFERGGYLRHGIELEDGACVLDVGANVGFFTLFVHARCRTATVYAFEPAPPAFELLCANTQGLGAGVRRFQCGLAETRRQATLTFYPRSSGMSSFHADRGEEAEVLRVLIRNTPDPASGGDGGHGLAELRERAEELIAERLAAQTYGCLLVPLSEIIREQAIPRIDLLKIDVQKSELAVLEGISGGDWPKIRQVVVEVHDLDGALGRARRLLEERGFQVAAEQDELYRGSVLWNLYARRPAGDSPAP